MLTRLRAVLPVARYSKVCYSRNVFGGLRNFSDSSTVDRDLQESYEGLYPRLMVLPQMFEEEGAKALERIAADGIVSHKRLVTSIIIYTDLQNPLLKKYEFDPAEFAKGAKEAFTQVHKAIASLSFFNYSNGISQDDSTDVLLKNVLHPTLYNACKFAVIELNAKGNNTHMTDIIVHKAEFVRVYTEIAEDTADNTIESQFDGSPSISVDYDLFSGHKLDKKKTETGTATDTDTEAVIKNTDLSDKTSNNDTIKEIKNEAEKLKNETTNIEDKTSEEKNVPDTECSVSKLKYPLGSVVAVVKMIFVAQEEYETTMPDGKNSQSKRNAVSKWTFKGCISGHDDLEWQITDFS